MRQVAAGRGQTVEAVRQVAKGRVWTGEDALAHGLVDALGGLQDAVRLAKQEAGLPLEARPNRIASVLVLTGCGIYGQQHGIPECGCYRHFAMRSIGAVFCDAPCHPTLPLHAV